MEAISLLIEYIYVPLVLVVYFLHIDIVKIKTKYDDISKIVDDISLIKQDLHHLVQVHKESLKDI